MQKKALAKRMNNENLHRIFDDTVCISTEKMIDYLEGSLLEKDKNSIELHLSSCSMCYDEFEGLQMIADKSTLSDTVFELNDKVDTILSSTNKKIPFLMPINLMAAIILFIIGFAWYVTYYINASLRLKEDLISQAFELPANTNSEIIIFRPDPSLTENEAVNNNEESTKNNRLLADNEKTKESNDFKTKSERKEVEIVNNNLAREETVVNIEAEKSDILDVNNSGIVSSEKMIAEDSKITNDKSKIGKEESNKSKDDERNVVALFDQNPVDSEKDITPVLEESNRKGDKKTALNKAKSSVSRSNTLGSDNFNLAMAEYNKHDYLSAIGLFKQSFNENEPQDKVHFYLATCYENISSHQEALTNYNKVIYDTQSPFYEQALWNKSQILLLMDKKKSAINSLNQIKNLNGKYSKQAENMLDSINKK